MNHRAARQLVGHYDRTKYMLGWKTFWPEASFATKTDDCARWCQLSLPATVYEGCTYKIQWNKRSRRPYWFELQ